MNRPLMLLLALGLAAAAFSAGPAMGGAPSPRAPGVEVQPGVTLLSFPARMPAADQAPDSIAHEDRHGGELGAVIALPPYTTEVSATIVAGKSGGVRLAGKPMTIRGQLVAVVTASDPGNDPITIAVHHDGDWHAKADSRLFSATLHPALSGFPGSGLKAAGHAPGGSYVIITAPRFAQAVAPLADWKTRKGWPVIVTTTDETGNTGADIRAWLQEAYDSWTRPPEYVLLVGNVADIPTFFIDGNVTDHPYALLDGDDWLPDLMIGRFAVDNETQCAVMVAKTVHYESQPYLDRDDWFTRGVMIGGQYGSTTPMHTVRFCGEQLVSIGFAPLVPVNPMQLEGTWIVSPFIPSEGVGIPANQGPAAINPAIDAGCSFVVYRGWAYGTGGWFSPTYQVANIENLDNGAMLPVVMSFVCHTGNFNAQTPCMGEVFTLLGGAEPAQFRGAVAFYGNAEPWSRTRYNDAMAISLFERVTDTGLTTLGSLINAGKLRFMEFFPGSLDETGDGFSVEYYFHIYNLLGDPELNYHRGHPSPMLVAHPTALSAGASIVDVAVAEDPGGQPVSGARVGIVQGGQLLGAGLTDADGLVRVILQPAASGGPVDLTVTRSGHLPTMATLAADLSEVFIALEDLAVTGPDAEPAPVSPGSDLVLMPTMRNLGSSASGAATLELSADGPVQISAGTVALGPLAAGATGAPGDPFRVTVDANAPDGIVIRGFLAASHGVQEDLSGFEMTVQAPELVVGASTAAAESWVDPGTVTDLWLTLVNNGSQASPGGVLAFSLPGASGATILTGDLPFGPLEAEGGQAELGPLTLELEPSLAGGTTLNIRIEAAHLDGALQTTGLAIPVGRGDVTEPSGPDRYGYYAFDSADYLYPDQRPVYRWLEISSAYGGPGTRLELNYNNLNRDVVVDLPFTFRFYGQDFDRARVSDNGWLSFDADNDFYNFYNWPIPLAHGNGALVAPFWDNLTPEPHPNPDADPVGMSSDGVYWYHDEPAGEVIFEWSRMRHIYDEITELQTFQAVLRDPSIHATTPTGDGEILFFYKQVADNDHLRMYATVGIESPDETDGLQLTYDGVRMRGSAPLGPGMAVRLTTSPPVRVPLTVTALARRQVDGAAHLAWVLEDDRPVVGWKVAALGPDGRVCLTPDPLPAAARSCVVAADAQWDLVLDALLPFGGICEAGTSAGGTKDLRFALSESVPNPVRGQASLAFTVPRSGAASLRVYDLRGRCVATLLDGHVEAGPTMLVWPGRDDEGRQLADGVYFLRLEQSGRSLTRKILLVR